MFGSVFVVHFIGKMQVDYRYFMGKSADKKRVVLVTGGAKRVGRAIVEKLADEGWDVVFTYNTSRDESTSVESTNGYISCVKADFNELDQYELDLRSAVEAK